MPGKNKSPMVGWHPRADYRDNPCCAVGAYARSLLYAAYRDLTPAPE